MGSRRTLAVLMVAWILLRVALSEPNATIQEEAEALPHRYRLYHRLFDSYNKNARPVNGPNDTATQVNMTFTMYAIVNVDERQQTMTTSGVLYMKWFDNMLAWNPKDFGNAQTMLINQEDMWVPDINVFNPVSSTQQLGYERGPILVESNGRVTWQPQVVFETVCSIDITYFPLDIQNCSVILGTRQSIATEVRLSAMEGLGLVYLWGFSPNSQWQLLRTDYGIKEGETTLSRAQIHLILRRRPVKIICNIFIPVMFLSATAALVFLLPIDGGDRMGTAVTVLLAYAVYLTIVSDSLPMNAMRISCLEMYLMFLLGLATIIALANVFLMRMLFKKDAIHPRAALHLRRVAHYLCMECFQPGHDQQGDGTDGKATEMRRLTEEVEQERTSSEHRDVPPKSTMKWNQAAKIMDRICFLIFALITILVSFIFLIVLYAGHTDPENNVLNSDFPQAGQ